MAFLNDLTLQQIVTRGLAYLLFAFAYTSILRGVARIGGNRSHPNGSLAAWGLLMAVLFRAGWVLVTSYTTSGRVGRLSQALAPVVASASILASIPLIDLLRPLVQSEIHPSYGQFLQILFSQIQEVALGSAIICLLPWPGLPGAQIILALKPACANYFRKMEWIAALILIGFMLSVFDPLWLRSLLSGLSLTL